MRYCTNCGHQLGVGRYCTNCGARVPVPAGDAPATPSDYPTAVRIGPMPPIPDADLPAAAPPPPPPPPPDLGPEPSSAR